MAHAALTVHSSLDAATAFDLLAHFDSVADWDPGIAGAERLDSGDLRVGSVFLVTAAFGPSRIPLTYVIKELDWPRRIVLEAVSNDFSSYDVITVEPAPDGSLVSYDATLRLRGWRRPADPALQAAFALIARRTESGLRRFLNPAAAAA